MKRTATNRSLLVREIIAAVIIIPFLVYAGEAYYRKTKSHAQKHDGYFTSHHSKLRDSSGQYRERHETRQFNYGKLLSLFRKTRRLQNRHASNFEQFIENQQNIFSTRRLIKELRDERDDFLHYFYQTRDSYIHKRQPIPKALQRRLHYYRLTIDKKLKNADRLLHTLETAGKFNAHAQETPESISDILQDAEGIAEYAALGDPSTTQRAHSRHMRRINEHYGLTE